MTQYWGDTRNFLLLILYNFRNIWRGTCPPATPPTPRSLDRQAAEAEKKNSRLAFMDFRVKDIYALLRYRFAKQVLFWKKINKGVFETVGFL